MNAITIKPRQGLAGVRLLEETRLPPKARVLVRVDWNIPLGGEVAVDVSRVEATLPTIGRLRELGLSVTVITHLGYPGGRHDERLRVRPVLGPLVRDTFPDIRLGENLRFSVGEEANDPRFAAELAHDHDLFVNEAFSCCHRPHASIVGVPGLLPGLAGPRLVREVAALDDWVRAAGKGTGLLVGGAKLRDKFRLLQILSETADVVAVGGLAALPFLIVTGRAAADDRVPADLVKAAASLLESRCRLHLPSDVRVRTAEGGVAVRDSRLRAGDTYLDIGEDTCARFARVLSGCARILWNGPLGRYEERPFHQGTAGLLIRLRSVLSKVTAGGGDTCAVLRRLGFLHRVGHASMGGGAMLSYLADGDLVGIAALRKSNCQPAR